MPITMRANSWKAWLLAAGIAAHGVSAEPETGSKADPDASAWRTANGTPVGKSVRVFTISAG